MNYPKYGGVDEETEFTPPSTEPKVNPAQTNETDPESMSLSIQEVQRLLQEDNDRRENTYLVAKSMELANSIPGIEYPDFDEYLDRAELLFDIMKQGKFSTTFEKHNTKLDNE